MQTIRCCPERQSRDVLYTPNLPDYISIGTASHLPFTQTSCECKFNIASLAKILVEHIVCYLGFLWGWAGRGCFLHLLGEYFIW